MPDVQNVFSFPAVFSQASSVPAAQGLTDAFKSAQNLQKNGGAKKEGTTAPEGDFLACFLAVLEQSAVSAVVLKEDAALAGETLDSGKPLFSNSVQDLLAPLQDTFAEKDVDWEALFKQFDALLAEARKAMPDFDVDKLKTLLPKLRNFVLEHPDVCAAVIDKLSQRLDAPQDTQDVSNGETVAAAPETQEKTAAETETTEEDLPELSSLQMSRFYSYLKLETLKDAPKAAAKEKTAAGEETAEAGLETSQADAVPVLAAPVSAAPNESSPESLPAEVGMAISRKGTQAPAENAEKKSPNSEITAEGSNAAETKGDLHDFSRRVANAAGAKENTDSAGDKNADEPQKKTNAPERVNSFSQFFDGIVSRRDQPESNFQVNDLKFADAPLARGEALREGVSNVVRFIRASGEQKASLIVDPPALGRISVELSSTTTGLEAAVKVSSEQIRQLVQEQLSQLRFSLEQQGVQLTHFSVDVQQDNSQRHQEQAGSQGRSRAVARDDGADEEETVFGVDLNEGLLYWVA